MDFIKEEGDGDRSAPIAGATAKKSKGFLSSLNNNVLMCRHINIGTSSNK